ncbi:MAG: pyruvate kinase [Chloroflexota bacterium]|nr:MAG: pyruvate kinase [Chloroflexota bacterium]
MVKFPVDAGAARRTKIVCTLGPASESEEVVRGLIRAGMDVARINFSHATHEQAARLVGLVRRLAREEGRVVALLQDLQGPRLRVGTIAQPPAKLIPGRSFTLTSRSVPGDASAVHVEYPELAQDVRPGDRVLLDEGNLILAVEATTDTDVLTSVVYGGELTSFKGINLPGVTISAPTITDKDRHDATFGVEASFDYIALSFVRRASDVQELKKLLASLNSEIPVIAKIEKHEALDNFEEILAVSDGIMVARGDLGVEVSLEAVPLLQKQIITQCCRVGKPVITATQMLESMVHDPRPTRAEVSDVANAVLDGTDALMLSGETANGAYPEKSVETMASVALAAERGFPYQRPDLMTTDHSITSAITLATCESARIVRARAILTLTASGYTSRMVAKHRPETPILAVTALPSTQQRLALVWGVRALLGQPAQDTDSMIDQAIRLAEVAGLVRRNDPIAITAGAPPGVAGRTNMLKVTVVGEGGGG